MFKENKKPFTIKDNHIITKASNPRKTVTDRNKNAGSRKSRKRKYRESVKYCKMEQENTEEGITVKKLVKLMPDNDATPESKYSTKNDQIVALITYKTNELTREQPEADKLALIITDDPTVPKLTRAKARELNKTPILSFPALSEQHQQQKHQHQSIQSEIINLINQELNSDEDDEEFTMQNDKEIVETQLPQLYPMKFNEDNCFKSPLDKHPNDHRIAARTRSKLCLEQTTIEAIQSSFVPPDVEDRFDCFDELGGNDEEWRRFLNDFTKPLNHNNLGDDDDPINDPEYIAGEKEPNEPAEELRDVNITKKELKDLVEELLESLNTEDISLDCIDLDPATNISLHQTSNDGRLTSENDTTTSQNDNINVTFCPNVISTPTAQNEERVAINNANSKDDVNAIVDINESNAIIPVGVPNLTDTNVTTVTIPPFASNAIVELIAVPLPDQPNCYQLARVVKTHDAIITTTAPVASTTPTTTVSTATAISTKQHSISDNMLTERRAEKEDDVNEKQHIHYQSSPLFDKRYDVPYDNNYTKEYISVRRHLMKEYIQKYENLRYAQVNEISSTTINDNNEKTTYNAIVGSMANKGHEQQQQQHGFASQYQYQLLQQQLRIHVQMLTQTFLQTHCHPDYWKMGEEVHEMLQELKSKSTTNSNFNAWNLNGALKLIGDWRNELNVDNAENKELMHFIHKEMDTTTSTNRQIPKFHPRIMEKILNSNVFMYPEYLPRMPFTHRVKNYEIFAPAEAQLIAMGLEKHLQHIAEKNEKIFHKSTPLSLACKRLCRDTIWGKTHRRVWDHIKTLEKADYYNPIKYFFEHNYKAPPIDPMPIIGFENGKVLPPKDCFNQLPLVWKYYVQEKLFQTHLIAPKRRKQIKRRLTSNNSDRIKNSKLQKNANVENDCNEEEKITIKTTSDFAEELLQNSIKQCCNDNRVLKRRKCKQSYAKTLTINVNYMFDSFNRNNCTTNNDDAIINKSIVTIVDDKLLNVSNKDKNDYINIPKGFLCDYDPGAAQATTNLYKNDTTSDNNTNNNKSPNNFIDNSELQKNRKYEITSTNKTHRRKKAKRCRLTVRKYRKVALCTVHYKCIGIKFNKYHKKRYLKKYCQRLCKTYESYMKKSLSLYKHSPIIQYYYRYFKALELYTNLLRDLKMFCRQHTIAATAATGTGSNSQYSPCSSNNAKRRERSKEEDDCNSANCANGTQRSIRKINRQEENIKHMLLPDNAEEANRKDAFYAYNFYERVEEAFKASKQPENYIKFTNMLKSFNPAYDKVADLYYKMESLFLPHHPELAEIFLTFLLPSDAAEIGKFFEHFIIMNMNTFVNKLNIYFNKQPAQIRKIYNCLNELANDTEVTMKKVENKILPLLKGNQFLIDWFLQQFPESIPPERLFSKPENINLKECQNKISAYDHVETVNDLLDSPTGEQIPTMAQQQQSLPQQQRQSCQLKYINGRIFYGSKVLLPAKLSFMANDYYEQQQKSLEEERQPSEEENTAQLSTKPHQTNTGNGCCHNAIREYGEKRLQLCCSNQADLNMSQANALPISTNNTNDDMHYKSKEDDIHKSLVIDVTVSGEEETIPPSSIECCDDNTLKVHAMRLNPSYYGSTWLSGTWEKCPTNHTTTTTLNSQFNAINIKKGHEIDGKISPRKIGQQQQHSPQLNHNSNNTISSSTNTNSNIITTISGSHNNTGTNNNNNNSSGSPQIHLKDKRKSPCKKIKLSSTAQNAAGGRNSKTSVPMVVIHDGNTSSAVACAKRLKTLIDEEERQCIDTKERLNIIARTKISLNSDNQMEILSPISSSPPTVNTIRSKIEMKNSNDCECLSENSSSIQNSYPNPNALLKYDLDAAEDDQSNINVYGIDSKRKFINNTPITIMDSDDDNNKITSIVSSFNNTDNITSKNIFVESSLGATVSAIGAPAALATVSNSNMTKRAEGTDDTTVAIQIEGKKEEDKSLTPAWTRDEDKIILLEMKFDCQSEGSERDCHDLLYERLAKKLNERSLHEIKERHRFLVDFLAKLQEK